MSATSPPPTDRARRAAIGILVALGLARGGVAGARPASRSITAAPVAASSIAVDDREAAAMLERLRGQRARVIAGRLVIDDIAGLGRPWVGTIERRGGELWLVTDGGALRLAGPLARPRVAGPGYRAWAIGVRQGEAPPSLRLVRIGILAPPRRAAP